MENILISLWNRNKIILKSFFIGILVLVLLIPLFMVQNIIDERQHRQQDALKEVSSKWANEQTLTGPVLAIPFNDAPQNQNGIINRRMLYLLPDQLTMNANVIPEKRYRGIYQVIVYTAQIRINGLFQKIPFAEMHIDPAKIIWNEAAVYFSVSDVRGLKEEVKLKLDDTVLDMAPGKFTCDQFKEALAAQLPSAAALKQEPIKFSLDLSMKGSGSLQFIPAGKQTDVQVKSAWPNPSFTGNYLPDIRSVADSGFSAAWKVLYTNRSYPQSWIDKVYNLDTSSFGVNLLVPVDAYQQTTRSVKYAILCIALTFTVFFLIELLYNKSIHPLQYVLVGFALCLFYTLLLSVSEYLSFAVAYLLAAGATITLITVYVKSMLRSAGMALFIASLTTVMYGFIFILIQLQDYALLMGSIGLFITLGAVMYFSRKIKWN